MNNDFEELTKDPQIYIINVIAQLDRLENDYSEINRKLDWLYKTKVEIPRPCDLKDNPFEEQPW